MVTKDREVYAKKIDTELNALSTKLSILEAAQRKAMSGSTFDYDRRLPDLRDQRDAIQRKRDKLQEGDSQDWESTRSGIETAMEDLENDINKAMHEVGLTSEREKEKSKSEPTGERDRKRNDTGRTGRDQEPQIPAVP